MCSISPSFRYSHQDFVTEIIKISLSLLQTLLEVILQCNQSEPLSDASGRIMDLMNENGVRIYTLYTMPDVEKAHRAYLQYNNYNVSVIPSAHCDC